MFPFQKRHKLKVENKVKTNEKVKKEIFKGKTSHKIETSYQLTFFRLISAQNFSYSLESKSARQNPRATVSTPWTISSD